MSVTITVSKHYAFAVIDVVLFGFLMLWKSGQVMRARKKYEVKYPTMYENKPDSDFNRYQRAHANSLEMATLFIPTLLLSALDTPLISAAAGLVFIFGRYMYAKGYYESVRARTQGAKFYGPAQLFLVAGTLHFAYKLLKTPEDA